MSRVDELREKFNERWAPEPGETYLRPSKAKHAQEAFACELDELIEAARQEGREEERRRCVGVLLDRATRQQEIADMNEAGLESVCVSSIRAGEAESCARALSAPPPSEEKKL